jgi:hypothetical protein
LRLRSRENGDCGQHKESAKYDVLSHKKLLLKLL